ncbi:hypothetical protein HPB47_005059 [Ixodes persulcatus]|uniref:Uncharacterized protein n=1 Tax=Ixodes persulcatus TaxID=34615 RepID=A0AC60PDZ0_IXOPE|nr:hypothetical protein HPB47_005059 [Ixodes persulcatus]
MTKKFHLDSGFPGVSEFRAAKPSSLSSAKPNSTKPFLHFLQVCEKHFSPGDFATTTKYTDEKTGRVLEVPLQLRRLKPSATPSIFPNCPAYLSRNTPDAREGPEEKRSRLEAEALQEALTLSTEAYEDEQRKNSVSSFDKLVAALKEFQVADFWTKLVTDKQVLFFNFAPRDAPVVRYSVTVSSDLSLKAFFGDLQLDKSDCLEDRFGRYRQLCGAQYHISIRQIYESEHKLRLQKVLELPEFDDISLCARTDVVNAAVKQFDVEVTAVDVEKKKEHMLPAITYVAGYCAHAALKKLMCPFCKENLVVDNRSLEIEAEELIAGVTRGELKFPQAVVVNAVLTMNIVLEKQQRKVVRSIYYLPSYAETAVLLKKFCQEFLMHIAGYQREIDLLFYNCLHHYAFFLILLESFPAQPCIESITLYVMLPNVYFSDTFNYEIV